MASNHGVLKVGKLRPEPGKVVQAGGEARLFALRPCPEGSAHTSNSPDGDDCVGRPRAPSKGEGWSTGEGRREGRRWVGAGWK